MTKHASFRTSYLVKRVELLVRTKLEVGMHNLGLTTGQYAALSLLATMPEASSAQLARAIGVTPQTMAETIVVFETDELIRREPSNKHKRVLKISLTPKGKAVLKKCEKHATEAEEQLFASLSADDVSQFRSHLLAILQSSGSDRF